MIKKCILCIIILWFILQPGGAQSFIKTSDLFNRSGTESFSGQMNIVQNPSLDTLISRYIIGNKNLHNTFGHYGMYGFRIQIYRSSNRNAREESNKARAEFMSKFPDIVSYPLYDNPGYFIVRAGDFRSKTEATRLFLVISKEFPDAYIVPDFINFPDLNKK